MVAAMNKLVLAAALLAGCTKAEPQHHAPAPLQAMTVDEVDTSLAKGEVQPVDVNGEATRQHEGVLPGAVLLTDDDAYKVSELPANKTKPLVFYCANTACSSSHHAAEKAVTAGYEHVRVMPDGIAGWVKAGKRTQKI
jgi:rhodanese-related sulfurtransferase